MAEGEFEFWDEDFEADASLPTSSQCDTVDTVTPFEEMAEVVEFWQDTSTKSTRSVKTVIHKFKRHFASITEDFAAKKLRRWKIHVENNGNRLQKLSFIYNYVRNHFDDANIDCLRIHDRDLPKVVSRSKHNH